ncbi:MAG: hypothetical protein JW891_00005, partial [Candidatus Lokiarchaeota archaeon]|nr:hypothetical protein [Candidatus Lokiarchaeota archaeon]
MYDYLREFKFEKDIGKFEYQDGEPLALSEKFIFYHNKNKFRKEITRLQNIFKKYTKNSLVASGIRDTYLKEEYSENYLILLFTTGDQVENTNEILNKHINIDISPNKFYLISTPKYMLLLAKDMNGLNSGINIMEEIFKQTFEDYFEQKHFDDFIKIRQFKINF